MYSFRGTKSGGKRKGRTDEPFRQAFGRISELRSLIPKCPLIALSTSIRISHRQLLQKVLSMEGAKVVNMSPNKTNVRLSAVKVADAADALSKLDWLVKLVQEKKAQTPAMTKSNGYLQCATHRRERKQNQALIMISK